MMWFRRLIEAIKAWRRGEQRVAPYGCRGRVFEKKDANPGMVARPRLIATMSTRVWREAEQAWYRRDASGNWVKE